MRCIYYTFYCHVCRYGVDLNAAGKELLGLLCHKFDDDRSVEVKKCHVIMADYNICAFTGNEILRNATRVTKLRLQLRLTSRAHVQRAGLYNGLLYLCTRSCDDQNNNR